MGFGKGLCMGLFWGGNYKYGASELGFYGLSLWLYMWGGETSADVVLYKNMCATVIVSNAQLSSRMYTCVMWRHWVKVSVLFGSLYVLQQKEDKVVVAE